MKHASTKPCRDAWQSLGRQRVVEVTAIGKTARIFLIEPMRQLQREGFDVVLVCTGDNDAHVAAQSADVNFHPVPIALGLSPVKDIVSVFRLWRLFRRLRPRIVRGHMSKVGLLSMLAARCAGIRHRIYQNHGMAFLGAAGWRHWLLRAIEWMSCALATQVLYCSSSTRTDAIRSGVCRTGKSKMLGPGTICGIDTARFDPDRWGDRTRALRAQARIPADAAIVGSVGRIVPHKGIVTVLEAWRMLPAEIRRRAWLCFLGSYGDFAMQRLVEQAVAEHDLHVRFLGFSDEMPAWYSAMELLVQASWYEGFPYSILEAACCGVPAVATKVSGTVDAVLHNRTGLLVPVGDPQAMAGAIARLLSNDELQQRLGQAARRRVLEQFRKEQICPLLLQEYRGLLCRRTTVRMDRITYQ